MSAAPQPVRKTTASTEIQRCIDACASCATICCQTLASLCPPGHDTSMTGQLMRELLDCSDCCQATASALCRGTTHVDLWCATCLNLCTACSRACEQAGSAGTPTCAEACRRCAEACRTACGAAAA